MSQFAQYKIILKSPMVKVYDAGDKMIVHKIPFLASDVFKLVTGFIFISSLTFFAFYYFFSIYQPSEELIFVLYMSLFELILGLVAFAHVLKISKQRSNGDGIAPCDSIFSIKTEVGGEIYKQKNGLNENIGKFDDLKVKAKTGEKGSKLLVFYCQDKELFWVSFDKIVESFLVEKGIRIENQEVNNVTNYEK